MVKFLIKLLILVIVVVIVGFPVVIVLAWLFDITPTGIRRDTGAAVSATDNRPSIAVLPFADLSPGGDQEYFSDGIAEEILNVLVRIEGLKVASRTTSWGFKGQESLGIPFIAEKMNVRHVLEGSVRMSGNRVRVTARLVDTGTETQLWSDVYEREVDDVFRIQDDIAKNVLHNLKIELEEPLRRSRNVNPEAYALVQQASQVFQVRSENTGARQYTHRRFLSEIPQHQVDRYEQTDVLFHFRGCEIDLGGRAPEREALGAELGAAPARLQLG